MNTAAGILVFALGITVAAAASDAKTYVGVITDTMCVSDHAAMKVSPDAKCVKDCVRDAKTVQYALLVGKSAYKLTDQQAPAKFAGQKVKITGVLDAKTNTLTVTRIDAVN